MVLSCLPSASDKAKWFAENFSKSSNDGDLGISLPCIPLQNQSETA